MKKSVVLIDDSEDQLDLMELTLDAIGQPAPLRIYVDGEMAVRELQRGDLAPDLILVDVHMPGMDGPTTVARLRAIRHLQRSRILMLSTSDTPEDIRRSIEAGADGYLLKPTGTRSWRDVLAQACEERDGDAHPTAG